ncbi:hypothetical protein [Rhodoferax sp.]|uniref:hypothetical protein n=1 Tax=Rhodoferax sp. TaxID=50421 RepID=UPI0025F4E1CB|nr:hypothetical protein [Rhodoferax sp.]
MLHLLRPTLSRLGWQCIESFTNVDGGDIDTAGLIAVLDIQNGINGWAKATSTAIPQELDKYFEKINSANLVLGFGLTPAMISLLERKAIPSLDFEVSPLRFGTNLFWSARTNHRGIRQALESIEIFDEFFWNEAASLSAALAWRGIRTVGEPQKTYSIFIGQMPIDLSLVADGSICSINDHKDMIEDYFSDVDEVLFSPHPYDTSGEVFFKISQDISSIKLTSEKHIACCVRTLQRNFLLYRQVLLIKLISS